MNLYHKIALDELRDTHLYDIHPFLKDEPAPKKLVDSISLSGILYPPMVLKGSDGNYDVISGRQRLKCVETVLHNSECLCRLLSEKSKPEDLLSLLLEDQFYNGSLTVMEQAWFIDLCKRLIPEKKALNSFLNSIPQGRIVVGRQFLAPLIKLDQIIQKKIHYSVISDKIVMELQRYNDQDQINIVCLIESLKLGINNQKKLIQFFTEILIRNEVSLSSLLADKSIKEVLDNKKTNTPQKTTQLFTVLHRLCHPLLSSAEDTFQQSIKNLRLPDHCQVKPASSFEKDEVTLSIRFENLTTFMKAWTELTKSIN